MRRTLCGVGGIAVLAVALLVTSKFLVRPRACVKVGYLPTTTFIGAAVARSGDTITFRVDAAVTAPRPVAPDPSAQVLEIGQRVDVTYFGDGARFVHQGASYLVPAYGQVPDALVSGVHQPRDCDGVSPPPGYGSGPGTAHADGSAIDTGLLATERIEPYRVPVALTAVAFAAAIGALLWRRAARRRRGDPSGASAGSPQGRTSTLE